MPAPPNPHAVAVLIMTLVALFLFTRENIPLQTSSLVVLVALAVGFELFPYEYLGETLHAQEFFYGFGHKALVAVCALMIVGQGLVRSGALEPVGRYLANLFKRAPSISLGLTLLIAAFLSAFINNTPIVVLMLPLLIGVAVRTGRSHTGMLMPMGLASLVGGMATTIGTSTNLLVVSVAADMGVAPFQMFDFVLPAAVAGILAWLYLWFVAPRLIPERQAPMADQQTRLFTAQIELRQDSPVVGSPLFAATERVGGKINVESIQRGSGTFGAPLPDVILASKDRITTTATPAKLREYAERLGGTLFTGEHEVDDDHPLSSGGQQLVELAITNGSRLIGSRVSEVRLSSRYGLRLLALHRVGRVLKADSRSIDQIVLNSGDVLLVQADAESLIKAKLSGDFLVLDGSVELPHTSKAPIALATIVGVVAAAAAGLLPIEVSAVVGCMILILTRTMTWRDATSALSVQVILIVVASLALGVALMRTGGADYIAQVFLVATFGTPGWVVLGSLMLLMAIMTNIVSNNAAAVIGTPIAIGIASRLGMPVEPFVLAVLFGSNLSFATPMAYKTNLLVMNAGGYKFMDFVKVGVPLMILMWLVLTAVLVHSYQLGAM